MSSNTMAPTPTNRKPADRLAELRQQIAALKADEEQLRAGFISGEAAAGRRRLHGGHRDQSQCSHRLPRDAPSCRRAHLATVSDRHSDRVRADRKKNDRA